MVLVTAFTGICWRGDIHTWSLKCWALCLPLPRCGRLLHPSLLLYEVVETREPGEQKKGPWQLTGFITAFVFAVLGATDAFHQSRSLDAIC